MIIGITGPAGAGKGEVVNYLLSKEFLHFSVRNFIIEEIKKQNLEINRDNMIVVANELRTKNGSDYIARKLLEKAKNTGKNCVIESIRSIGEVEILKNNENFILLGVDADIKLRYERILKRGSETDKVNFKKFKEQEDIEMKSNDINKQNISKCMDSSDFKIMNNGTLKELHELIDKILLNIQ
ncbi:MAG: AAA family ATPase [Candidatus Woesearchaeota archaeon]